MQLNALQVKKLMQSYLDEDVGMVDYAQCDDIVVTAEIVAKEPGVMCGGVFVRALFEVLECEAMLLVQEGRAFTSGTVLVKIIGRAPDLLSGERTALNILARTIGIATCTHNIVKQCETMGWRGRVAGTRKTTPGFRQCEKYALFIGGADPHRMTMHDCCMIKDNHLAIHADCPEYVHDVKRALPFTVKLEVETSSLEGALWAAKHADIVMLDNVGPEEAKAISERVKRDNPGVLVEVSGGITAATIGEYLWPTVDVISMGALTMHSRPVDLSLRVTTN